MSSANPTLFDKLVADLAMDGLRDDSDEVENLGRALRNYTVPRLEQFGDRALRATLLRELNWLLNTTNLAAVEDLSAYPEVARSTLNYGLCDLTGKLLYRQELQQRAREMREAIGRFEPRVEHRSMEVEVDYDPMRPTTIGFIIRGDLTGTIPVELRTEVEIDTGSVSLRVD